MASNFSQQIVGHFLLDSRMPLLTGPLFALRHGNQSIQMAQLFCPLGLHFRNLAVVGQIHGLRLQGHQTLD